LTRRFQEANDAMGAFLMMKPDRKTTLRSLLLSAVTASACGPDAAQTDAGTGTSTGTDASSTDSPTGAPEPCSRIHEGDLRVLVGTDLASLADLGRVTEDLTISMGELDQRDLSFLSCLHTVDGGLDISRNVLLESTAGLENLKSVDSISFFDNDSLRTVTGFNQIQELTVLNLRNNPALESLQFDSLATVKYLSIGGCQQMKPDARHFALTELSGFSSLTTVQFLTLAGNEALMSAGLLEALEANGATPLLSATIRFNPLLPEATVNARLDVLGVIEREVCGNAEGDAECYCQVGE